MSDSATQAVGGSDEEVRRRLASVMATLPFTEGTLLRLTPLVLTREVNAIAVVASDGPGGRTSPEMRVNPDFVNGLDDELLGLALRHEAYNLMMADRPTMTALIPTPDWQPRWDAQLRAEFDALVAEGAQIDWDENWTQYLSPEAIARLDEIEGLDVPPLERETAWFGSPSRMDGVEHEPTGTAWDTALETPVNVIKRLAEGGRFRIYLSPGSPADPGIAPEM